MKYLVTGGAGFIGSNLVNELIKKDNEVTVVDNLSMGSLNNFTDLGRIDFIKGSVIDESLMTKILSEKKYDYIFHLAAIASVADSIDRPIFTHKVNYDSVLYLLELCRKYQPKMKRFIFASSAAVYGDLEESPKKEDFAVKPMTQYAVDKYAAERTVINFYNLYNVPTSVVRFFNVYGPNQNPSSPYSGVVSILMDKFKSNESNVRSEFTLFGDGEQTRDFIFVKDVISALKCVSESNSSLGEVYNVGTGCQTSLNSIIKILSQIFDSKLPIVKASERNGDIKKSVSDNSKLCKLGFSVKYDVNQGLNILKKSID